MPSPTSPTPDEAAHAEAARRQSLADLLALARGWRAVPPAAFPVWLEAFVAATLAHVREHGDGEAFGPLVVLLGEVRNAPAHAAAVSDAVWARLADALTATPAAGPLREARAAAAAAREEAQVLPVRPAPVGAVRAVGTLPPTAAPARARPVPPPPKPWQPPTL